MSIVLTKVVQTCYACPSQWDAWDTEGRYCYLRYRSGVGTVESPHGTRIASFEHGDGLDGVISLADFAALAGLSLSPAVGGHLSDELIFTRDDSVSCELPSRTRRFLVARWPDGLTKVREVFMSEDPEEQP